MKVNRMGTEKLTKDEPAWACYSATAVPFRVELAPTVNEEQFVEKMQALVRKQFTRWLECIEQRATLPKEQVNRLRNLRSEVRFDRNSIGSVRGDRVTLDEGNLLVGYAWSYAMAKLERGLVNERQFNAWHDFFIDSIMMGDPIVHVDGQAKFSHFINSAGGIDQDLRGLFLAKLNAWVALTMMHEAAHVILGHGDQWRKQYPTLRSPSEQEWSDEQFALSRLFELEADKESLQVYMLAAGFDPGSALTSWAEWQLIRWEAVRDRRLTVFPTHPEPEQRILDLAGAYASIQKMSSEETKAFLNMLHNYISALRDRIREEAPLREVPRLRGERPVAISPNIERFMSRDAQLRILAD